MKTDQQMKKIVLFTVALFTIGMYGCTKLHEGLQGNLTPSQVAADTNVNSLMNGVYGSMEIAYTDFLEVFALSELTTDEAIAPTRANNWDDNGVWRVLHQQKWDANNDRINLTFNSLGGIVFAATDVLQYHVNTQQKAEARFLRAWAMYWFLDLFNQVPYRNPGDSLVNPAKVFTGIDALNYIISELNVIQKDLPTGPADIANQNAVRGLLMKCYLNKGVYADRANPVFDPADMNQVISLADEIISSGQFSFTPNYFDNFSPENKTVGTENIFTQRSSYDGNYNVFLAWIAVYSYAQGGANGFTTLSDFYDKFDSTDKRRQAAYDYVDGPPNPAHRINTGFLIGQQYDLFSDDSLFWPGSTIPVIYTREVENTLPGPDLLNPGIRPMKYAPDYINFTPDQGPARNEFVYLRFADVLLMKAEAILRGGTGTNVGPYGSSALSIVNAIRTDPSRGISALTSLNVNDLYDERGRELWWENWRRQDMIRFSKFLEPFQEKAYQSDSHYLIFPIPNQQLSVNPYLIQNPGYN
jgi:hypothetical protein